MLNRPPDTSIFPCHIRRLCLTISISDTDDPTFTPTSHCDWPAVQRWDSMQGLYFLNSTSPSGEKLCKTWKMLVFVSVFKGRHLFSLRWPTCHFTFDYARHINYYYPSINQLYYPVIWCSYRAAKSHRVEVSVDGWMDGCTKGLTLTSDTEVCISNRESDLPLTFN